MGAKVKIAIIGSGPAGLSAAARAADLGLSHVLIEKTDHLSDTIYKYQKGKHIMATPDQLTLRSNIDFEAGSREAILERWDEQAQQGKINVMLNTEVTEITGQKGQFKLETSKGETIEAENVVLAIGTQGNPNTMRCPGGDLDFIQYQLDDASAYFDEDIIVIGGGDAGIENALGLCDDPELENRVTLLQRAPDFPTAKGANIKLMMQAKAEGRLDVLNEASTTSVEPGWINIDVKDGTDRLPCDRVIARIGSAPPRKFVESCGVKFSSEDRTAFPVLSPTFESSVPGLYVIGALAGYPLIKHCINQGYDAVEIINGNKDLKPADEPLLVEKFKSLPSGYSVSEWLDHIHDNVEIFSEITPLQLREFMLDSIVHVKSGGDVIFKKNDIGSSLFAIVSGSVFVGEPTKNQAAKIVIPEGEFFGETGLISGRRRNATITAAQDSLLVEIPRTAARKLISTVPPVKRIVDRIATERQLMKILGADISKADLAAVTKDSEIKTVPADTQIIQEGDVDKDIYILQSGSLIVEKQIGDKDVFLSYVPAGNYVGEMALFENGVRTASVKTAIKSEIIKLKGENFEAMLAKNPELQGKVMDDYSDRRALNAYVEGQKDNFSSVAELFSARANFLMEQGIGEATDALLIDETLCIGCDNCEVACAETHDGISRLDREAGTTFDHLHVPTSCRHCEHPHCMSDCPPDAIHRAPNGEVYIDDSCIGCGNCERYCPYGVIQMEQPRSGKPGLLPWVLFGIGSGPGQNKKKKKSDAPKLAVKCDMCKGISGGAACVRACPTGAAIRISPEDYLSLAKS